jgi:hypothetical protein
MTEKKKRRREGIAPILLFEVESMGWRALGVSDYAVADV